MPPVARNSPDLTPAATFSAFIRERKTEILAAWEQTVRQMPIAASLERPALIDHIPDLLDRIAAMADDLVAGQAPALPPELAEVHATERLEDGFDLAQVIAEYGALRDCILQLWAEDDAAGASTRALHRAIDRAVAASVQRFTLARDRTLVALDRISSAALETRSLDELLQRLLVVFKETTAAVDVAAIKLGEQVRASVGDEHANAVLGQLSAPLVETGVVIGTAYMGSLTARTFSKQDERLFVAMANRASSAISLHMLREREQALQQAFEQSRRQREIEHADAERTLTVMDTILAASALGIAFLDTELRYVRINEALAALNAAPAAAHVGRTAREILGDEAAEYLEPILRRVIETRVPVENLELRAALRGAPDQVRWFNASYVPVITPHGELLGIGAVVIDVTERKRMENELRDRELHLRLLADNIAQLAWIGDASGAIIWYNQRWYDYTGTTDEQMRHDGWRTVHHPEHAERVAAKFAHHIESGEVWEDTFPLRGADGEFRWFLSRAMPIRDEHGRVLRWFGTNTDVTQQRVTHEAMVALSSSRDYHETLERVARLAVPTLGDWCAIDIVENNEVKRLAVAHIDPTKVAVARDLATRFPQNPDARTGVPNVIRTGTTEHVARIDADRLARGAERSERLEIVRTLGLQSYVIAPLIAGDRVFGAISVVAAESGRSYTSIDIATIEELGRRCGLAIDNARLFAEAQRETRMREEMLALVSHDLRSPLNSVSLAATMLLEDAPPHTRKPLETIHRAARRMDHLLADLLDMASIQAGRLAVDRQPEDGEALLREVIDTHEPAAREKQIRLVSQCMLLGARLCADRDRLLQVFGNLVGNAIKFCRPGDTVTIRCENAGTEGQFTIVDTGPGISDAELPHIFEPYWSAKRYAKKGTGLGLYISKGIVEAHGGRLWADSQPGTGAAFHFTIPFA